MTDPLVTLSRARQLATGSVLGLVMPTPVSTCRTESDLDGVVTTYYKFYNEELAGEASFLLSVRTDSVAESFRRLLYKLRTATNHSDNAKAIEFAQRWRAGFDSPQSAADFLTSSLTQAVRALALIAVEVSKDRSNSGRWSDMLSVDVGTVFDAVACDLSRSYTVGNRQRMVRIIEKRLQIEPGRGDRRSVVADYCAQEMISDRSPLPVPYSEVLSALNLLGDANADGALLAAHAVAALAPALGGADFLGRVRDTWQIATSD